MSVSLELFVILISNLKSFKALSFEFWFWDLSFDIGDFIMLISYNWLKELLPGLTPSP